MAGGPQITIGMDSGDFEKKLKVAQSGLSAARKELNALNREMDSLARKGQKITAELAQRAEAAEAKVDSAKNEVARVRNAGDGDNESRPGRPSYGFRKWQSQFAEHGSGGVGKHMSMLMGGGLSMEGVVSSFSQLAGLGVMGKLLQDAIKIPENMEKIQSIVRDHIREELGSTTYLSPLEKLRRQQKTEETVIGEIPLVGGILSKGNSIGTRVRQLIAGEENIENVDLRVKNEEAIRRLGLGGSKEAETRVKNQKVSQFSRAYANFVGNLDPAQVELQKNIEAATKLLEAGMTQAARGNIVGDTTRGGFGGARDYFSRANQILPGIAPQDASATYQALEQARLADRNFARSQMARAGPRTGD